MSNNKKPQEVSYTYKREKKISLLSLLGVYEAIAFVFALVSAAAIFNACFEYDSEFVGGFSSGLAVMTAMLLIGMPIFLVGIYSSNYPLLLTMPVKSQTVPLQMSLITDVTHLLCATLEISLMLYIGKGHVIVYKLFSLLVIYILAHISLYIATTPALRSTAADSAKKGGGIWWFFAYIIGCVVIVTAEVLIAEETKLDAIGLTAVMIAIVIGAVVTRILTYKGIKNKVRVIKIYKPKKAKKQKELSYV